VGPRAILDAVVKRKISSSHWESNPRTPTRYIKQNINSLSNKKINTKYCHTEQDHEKKREK
jgi:hypothetical protein